MGYENIEFKIEGNLGILTVNRPKALNALNTKTIREMTNVLDEVKNNDSIQVLIITGAGDKAFIAGADINELKDLNIKEALNFFREGHNLMNKIEDLGKPTIAAVNGFALGGGCEVAIACTLRIVSEKAKFGLPELNLGVIPGFGGTQRLARLIGRGRANWHILTGDMIDADTAVNIGLANLKVNSDELLDSCKKVAEKIISKAPLAIEFALNSVKYGNEAELPTGLILETAFATLSMATKDKDEGIKAFFEKRKPNFKGE